MDMLNILKNFDAAEKGDKPSAGAANTNEMKTILESFNAVEECGMDMPPAPQMQPEKVKMNVNLNADGIDAIEDLIKLMGGKGEQHVDIDSHNTELPMKMPMPKGDKEPDMAQLIAMTNPPKDEGMDEEWDNAPEEEYSDHDKMIHDLSGGLNREKKAYAATQDGDNAMAVEADLLDDLRAQLSAEWQEKISEAPQAQMVQSSGTLGNWNIDKSKPKNVFVNAKGEEKIIYATPDEIKLAQTKGNDLKGFKPKGPEAGQDGAEVPVDAKGNPQFAKGQQYGTVDGVGVEKPPADPNALPPIKDGDEIPDAYLDKDGNPDWSKIPKEVTTGMIGGTGVERPPQSTPQQSGGAAGEFGGTGSAPTPQQSGGKGGEFDTGAGNTANPAAGDDGSDQDDGAGAAPAADKPAAGGVLKVGSKGDEVKAIQTALGINADGIFGKGTEKAVKDFQTAQGIKADGIVGPDTRAKIENPESAGQQAVNKAQDAVGGAVDKAQDALGVGSDTTVGKGIDAAQDAVGKAVDKGQEVAGDVSDAVAGAWDDVKNWASGLFGSDDEAAKATSPEETKKSLTDKMAEIQAKLKELEAAEKQAPANQGADTENPGGA